MKIPTKKLPYEEVVKLPKPQKRKPWRPLFLLQLVIRVLAFFDLAPVGFTYTKEGMEKIGKKEP